ncbi:transporter substrate-binding domain-containing protein [Hippea jasoniae]|uniref:transporter substrate-binding domain-containing protein n=1 Tax=Hippea jasoniae TaxID=944479 RepID=UPI000556D1F9|nr:transporter substrate-binding domain-containing protein [Hippea jasoniae]
MKGFYRLVALLVAVFIFGSFSAKAADINLWHNSTLYKIEKRGVLRVGLNAGYMPFEMRSKTGKIIGFDVDMAKLMAKAMGVKLQIINTDWDGIIPALMTGKFDIIMSGMTITQKRNLKVNFADPYIVVGQTILLNKKWAGKVKSYKDLNSPKFTVTVMLGTTGDFAAKKYIPKAKIEEFQTEEEAVMQVMQGRADAFVYDQPYNSIFHATKGKGKLIFLNKPFTYEPLGWAINKGDPDFLNWLNNFLRQIKHDGAYDKLYKKWFVDVNTWINKVQ